MNRSRATSLKIAVVQFGNRFRSSFRNSFRNKGIRLLRRTQFSLLLGFLTLALVTHPIDLVLSALPSSPSSTLQVAVSATDWLDQGRISYQAGRYLESKQAWQEAVRAFQQQQDTVGEAWSLSYLSLAHQALGEWSAAESAINRSLGILQQTTDEPKILGQALMTQGQLYCAQGKTLEALESWEAAEAMYQQAQDQEGQWGSQINQAQALKSLGLYRRSYKLLRNLELDLVEQPDSLLKLQGLHSLGNTLRLLGNFDSAQQMLEQGLEMAERLDATSKIAEIQMDLGTVYRSLQQPQSALTLYQQAIANALTPALKLETQLNQLRLQIQSPDLPNASPLNPLIAELSTELRRLPASRVSVDAAINFATSLAGLQEESEFPAQSIVMMQLEILTQALQDAQTLEDQHAEAAVLVQLGRAQEQAQERSEALALTQQGLQIAQSINASEVAAQAAWQLGRLLKQQGDLSNALIAYRSAYDILQVLRNDLVAVSASVQFSFQETIEPVYRELVSLLLQPTNPSTLVSEDQIREAQTVIEALRVAELDNFFKEACLITEPIQIDQVDKTAAVIYPILLPDRLEVIASLPQQPLQHYAVPLPQEQLLPILSQMRQSLHPAFSDQERLELYQAGYDWMIRPIEPELERLGIETLVFVLDSELRDLPMSALFDGQQYLVEKYNIALSPGLQLFETRPLELTKQEAIAAGLSEARQGFSPLPGVQQEIQQISTEVSTEVILNQSFTTENLKEAIQSSPAQIVHLATHGQFSSQANETFVVTWDGRINVLDFDTLLRSREVGSQVPVDLLVLSACQTAQGDRQAALGLAGVAVRSGARSTVASLWAVWDESTTELMAEFYEQLGQPGMTKSAALRQSQLKLIQGGEYSHPTYWAPFVLVGNWQ
ncbi:MAG: CHAT domain-containing protein [Microcoleaceae cyanobacterium]